jgi:FkbM family methyltransferase
VLTFEPDSALYECLQRNVAGCSSITASPVALGPERSVVKMKPHIKAGSWSIDPAGSVDVPMMSIDMLGLSECDALVLDVEGYEVPALQGASKTIKRCRPMIHVEQLRAYRQESDNYLRSIGYAEQSRAGTDALYGPT